MKKLINILKSIIMYSFEIVVAILLFLIGVLFILFTTIFSKNGEKKE